MRLAWKIKQTNIKICNYVFHKGFYIITSCKWIQDDFYYLKDVIVGVKFPVKTFLRFKTSTNG